jgi:hypothetical protein
MSAHGPNEICYRTNFETCSLLLNARARVQTHTHKLQKILHVGLCDSNIHSIMLLAEQSIPDLEC